MEDQNEFIPIVDLTIEVGVLRMRAYIGSSAPSAYVPRLCVCVDQGSGMILHCDMTVPLPDYATFVADTINAMATNINGFPHRIITRDSKLAAELRREFEQDRIEVVVRESLPMFDLAAQSLLEFKRLGGAPEPALLDQPGMTLDHVLAFADAAEVFHKSRPWRHLTDDDLIEIESPTGPEGTKCAQVLGAGGQTYGIGFVASRQVHDQMQHGAGIPRGGVWTLQFGAIDDLPYDDGETWERHHLPVANELAYPSFWRFKKSSRKPGYPTPAQLAWAEGLLRAVACTTEAELDSGRWEKVVQTHVGTMTFKLSMPLLLEQMAGKTDPHGIPSRMSMEPILQMLARQVMSGGKSGARIDLASLSANPLQPTTDAERAQQLCYQAHESRGRRQVQLARQALAIDSNCCDALLILAQRQSDPADCIPLFQRAVDAAASQLDDKVFKHDTGHFWGLLETRPYMRARQGLALGLMTAEQWDDAAGHLRDLLRLNPGDNQGNRYPLAQCLLYSNQLDALEELLNHSEYHDDTMAEWTFLRVLLAFRKDGDTPGTRKKLEEATRSNAFVLPLLTGRKNMPPFPPPSYAPGSEDEAILCAQELADAWDQTPGAIEWLEQADEAKRRVERAAKRTTKRKGKKR